jgi:hypothetical protein
MTGLVPSFLQFLRALEQERQPRAGLVGASFRINVHFDLIISLECKQEKSKRSGGQRFCDTGGK